MIRIVKIFLVFFLLVFMGCNNSNNEKAKLFKEVSEKTTNVSDRIVSVPADLFFKFGDFALVDDLLIYIDYASVNPKSVHLFDRKSLKYISSVGQKGRGPGEITSVGSGCIDYRNKNLWIHDNGKQVNWMFPIDSIISNDDFLPRRKFSKANDFFLVESQFISDSIVLGVGIVPLSVSSMEMTMARQNIFTGKIERFGYAPNKTDDRYDTYFSFVASVSGRFYVNCFTRRDQMIIVDFDGNLIADVKGTSFEIKGDRIKYFTGVDIYKDYIIASYIGGQYVVNSGNGGFKVLNSTKFLVFDSQGNFLKTLDVGSQFSSFIIDEKYDRIVLFFDEKEDSFGYFAINDLLTN